jgi:hypothetical protein
MKARNGVLAVLVVAAVACGGSDGGDGNDGGGGGQALNATSVGEVRGFGSVVVNGVRWSTSGATLRLDDSTIQLGGEDNVRQHVPPGAVVTVKGDRDGTQGTARQIEFKSIVEGPIAGNGAAGFTIAGLTVAVDASTTLVDAGGTVVTYSASALTNGQRVEVSGTPESATVLRASLVRVKSGNQAEYEAKGYVVGLSGVSFGVSLVAGGAPYLNVTSSAVLPVGLANGSIVEVKGTAFAAGAPGTLTATVVELEDRLLGDRNAELHVEGVLTGLGGATPAETFTVNGQGVALTAATQFSGAADPAQPRADLADGLKVEVEGQLDAAGTLVARRLKFKDGARIEAPVAGSAASGFTVLGKRFVVDPSRTRFDGVSAGSIAAGQRLEIRGYPMIDGTIFAQRVRLRSGGNDRPFIQGVVTQLAGTSATILGIPIELANASDGYRNVDDTAMSQAAFLAAIRPGETIVKVRWERESTSTSDRVREAELEDD